MGWDGKERRQLNGAHKELLDRLGAIDVKIGIVETKVDGLYTTNRLVADTLREHSNTDHWVFGIIISILVIILGKVFIH